MWSQQAGTANNSCLYRTSNMGPQEILSNRQTSKWETSAVRRAFASQPPAIGKTSNDYHKMLHSNLQSSFTNTQSGNPFLLDTNGRQVATQQDSHPNSGSFKANTTYSQPGMAGHWNQRDTVQTHSRQNIQNQNHRQNGTHHGYSPTNPPAAYNVAVSQSFRNNNITTNSSLSEQIVHSSSTSRKTQQYPYHPNSNHNNIHYALSKTNNDTQEQMHRNQVVARIADELRKSSTASSEGRPPVYTSSPCREKQFFSERRMTEPNQNMQPVTMTVSQSHNSNASQSLSLNPGLTLTNTSHNFMSKTQHSVDLPQQSSVSNVFYFPATVDGSGNGDKAANACFKSSNGLSQLRRMLETISPQEKTESEKTESNATNSDTILGMRQFVIVSDGNIHSSPGRIATKAVAVVPPLSQEYYEVASMHTSSDTINQSPAKDNLCKIQVQNKSTEYKEAQYFREIPHPYPEIPNYSAASNDSTCSAGCQALSQKQLCSDDSGSKLATSMQVDQRVAPTAQQSVTSELPVSSSGHTDRSENQTDSKAPVSEVSAGTPWAIGALTELVQAIERDQMKFRGNSTVSDYSSRELLLSSFWDGNAKNLSCKLRTGWYKDLMDDVLEFCHKHVTLDSVILTQENSSFKKQPQKYHVLKNDEVYSEPPYKSLWLNVNEELDDIDKEFGFPWSLKHHHPIIESHSQPEQFETIKRNPAHLVDSGEEKQTSTVEATTTQAASPNKTESADSSDPYYSFEIQVLPPEEARVIYEQTQSKKPQSMDKDSHSSEENSLVGVELPEAEDRNVTLNDCEVKNTTVCPMEQICCISRWMEMICGSDTPGLSKCQCKNEESLKDCTDGTPDKEEMVTCSPSELCNEPSQIIDLTENGHKSYSHSEPKNFSQISGSKSSIVERKQKRSSSHDPLHKKSNKRKSPDNVNSQPSTNRKVLTDDSEPSASNVNSLQLVLFGSAPQDSCVSIGNKKRHISSTVSVSDGALRPPKYLSVNLSPLSGKSSETVPTREYTVKRWIYEKWRRSFPPFKIRCRSKLKAQKCAFSSFSGVSLRKAEMVESTRIWNQNPKHRLSLTRRRSLRDRLKSGEERTKMDVVTLKQPADKESRNAENGSHGVRPLQENNVLKFNVLPNTFNFKDRSNEGKEINGPFPNKTALDEGKDSSPNKPLVREKGTWYPNLEKKYCPPRSPPILKNSSIFHEFQKKYKEKTQPLMKK